MSQVQDRLYQREFVHGNARFPGVFGAWEAGKKSVVGLLPTGCGKTICAGLVAAQGLAKYQRRTLLIAHREELIRQASEKLTRMGLETAIEMGEERATDLALFGEKPDVVVATVQTLQKRRLKTWNPHEFGIIITDECHHARAKSYQKVYDHFKGYWHLGITATWDRGDGLNIGSVYEDVAFEYSLRDAIRDKWLCEIVCVRLPCDVNLKDIKTTGGDYNQSELEARIAPHVEALCDAVLSEIGTRPTVLFCPDVGSSEAAADAITKLAADRGVEITARAVSGRMSREARRETLDAYARGEFQVLCCCDLLIEGWDCPRVKCVVVMRPTKSRARYVQMIGRGTRPFADWPNVLVLDFAWETTSAHELVSPVELFDDSLIDDDVAAIATELMASGKERDPIRAIDEAERIHKERIAFKIQLTGKRTTYQKVVYDPVGVGGLIGLPIKKGWDFNPSNPASDKQLQYLADLGVEQAHGLSKNGAGKIIDKLNQRRAEGLASIKQVKYLIGLGVTPDSARTMTKADASAAIDKLHRKAG
jgi:superfamily II DNA or RNA helicase